jgi:hypothetical protein
MNTISQILVPTTCAPTEGRQHCQDATLSKTPNTSVIRGDSKYLIEIITHRPTTTPSLLRLLQKLTFLCHSTLQATPEWQNCCRGRCINQPAREKERLFAKKKENVKE